MDGREDIDGDANPTRLLISSSRKPVSYVNLAKRFLQVHGEVQLSALGVAISSMVTLAEILKNKQLAVETRIVTSLEEISSDSRTRHKPKMSVTLVKSPHFDDIVAAENAGREGRDGVATGSAAEDSGNMSGLRGPRHYVGGGGPGSRQGPIAPPQQAPPRGGDIHGLRGGAGGGGMYSSASHMHPGGHTHVSAGGGAYCGPGFAGGHPRMYNGIRHPAEHHDMYGGDMIRGGNTGSSQHFHLDGGNRAFGGGALGPQPSQLNGLGFSAHPQMQHGGQLLAHQQPPSPQQQQQLGPSGSSPRPGQPHYGGGGAAQPGTGQQNGYSGDPTDMLRQQQHLQQMRMQLAAQVQERRQQEAQQQDRPPNPLNSSVWRPDFPPEEMAQPDVPLNQEQLLILQQVRQQQQEQQLAARMLSMRLDLQQQPPPQQQLQRPDIGIPHKEGPATEQ